MAENTSCDLARKECKPCKGDTPPLTGDDLRQLHEQVSDWELEGEHHIHKTWKFDDFQAALDFVNRVGETAERESHHPVITFTYGKATIKIYTHKIDGLTESDFVLAAKIDELDA